MCGMLAISLQEIRFSSFTHPFLFLFHLWLVSIPLSLYDSVLIIVLLSVLGSSISVLGFLAFSFFPLSFLFSCYPSSFVWQHDQGRMGKKIEKKTDCMGRPCYYDIPGVFPVDGRT